MKLYSPISALSSLRQGSDRQAGPTWADEAQRRLPQQLFRRMRKIPNSLSVILAAARRAAGVKNLEISYWNQYLGQEIILIGGHQSKREPFSGVVGMN